METVQKEGLRRSRVSLAKCPRCSGKHLDLLFVAFTYRDVLITDQARFNMWALCKETREPIIAWARLSDDEIVEVS